jgi:SAM-dependent methyltransferase
MTETERYFRGAVARIARDKRDIVDIGGSLRCDPERGNKYAPEQAAWVRPLLEGRSYRILDKVDTHHPHIVADVQKLPFADGELEAVLCLSVLSHVEDPMLAMRELHRAICPGGYLLLWLPFLFPYAGMEGYYQDYWRFTADGVRLLTRAFSDVEVVEAGGRISAVALISPFARYMPVRKVAARLDKLLYPRSPHGRSRSSHIASSTRRSSAGS